MIKKFVKNSLNTGRKYYRFIILLCLIVLAGVVRISVYYVEQHKPIYNIERLHKEKGVPVHSFKIEKSSEVFYEPLTVVKTKEKNYYSSFVGPDLKNSLIKNGRIVLNPEGEVVGHLLSVSSNINLDVGLYPVKAFIKIEDDSDAKFYEVFAEVKSVLDSIILPRDIIQYDSDNNAFVYKIVENKAQKTLIKLGFVGRYKVVVLQGLDVDDEIVKSDALMLNDGDIVKVDNN